MAATSFDPATVDAFQMAGQDVPWLLDHWATNKPDHPFLIWEPRDGNGPHLDLRRVPRRGDQSLAAGLTPAASPRATRS